MIRRPGIREKSFTFRVTSDASSMMAAVAISRSTFVVREQIVGLHIDGDGFDSHALIMHLHLPRVKTTLTEKNGSVVLRLKHFNANLTGWEERATVLEFPLVKITPTEAHFDGMIFTHSAKDAFSVRLKIGDKKTGAVPEELFTYTRVAP